MSGILVVGVKMVSLSVPDMENPIVSRAFFECYLSGVNNRP